MKGAAAASGPLGPGLAILASMVAGNAGAAWAKHLCPLVGAPGGTAGDGVAAAGLPRTQPGPPTRVAGAAPRGGAEMGAAR